MNTMNLKPNLEQLSWELAWKDESALWLQLNHLFRGVGVRNGQTKYVSCSLKIRCLKLHYFVWFFAIALPFWLQLAITAMSQKERECPPLLLLTKEEDSISLFPLTEKKKKILLGFHTTSDTRRGLIYPVSSYKETIDFLWGDHTTSDTIRGMIKGTVRQCHEIFDHFFA